MTQGDQIISYLKTFKTITPFDAFTQLGVTKLSTRISELKKEGYKFKDSWIKTKNRWGKEIKYKSYSLIRSED